MSGTEFTPFDDSQQVAYIPTDSDTGGSLTLEIDPFRQGVELRTNRQRFSTTQPKIWSGNLDHQIDISVIGQARTFTEYENSQIWKELPEFDPIAYIELGANYPLPIVFNDGPQEEEEASLEPITIPFRKNTNEGPFFAHRVAGCVGDGNNFDTIFRNSNRTSQFWDYLDPLQKRLFLDEGSAIWGEVTDGIIREGYVFGLERLLRPFDDTSLDDIVESTSAATDLQSVLVDMQMNLDQDLRPLGTKSASANTFVYGRDSAKYGTDSIAYLGLTRGS